MDLIFIPILFVGGIISGLYASSVGSGALVTFPLLILAGLPTHVAIATNRLGAVFLELSSTIKFHRAKKLKLKYGLWFGGLAALGSIIGANLVIQINEKALNLIVAVIFFAVFLFVFNQDKINFKPKLIRHRHIALGSVFTFLAGIYGGFFGIGFGTLIMFPFIVAGLSLVKSAAIGRIAGFMMSFTSTAIFAYHGLINYTYGLTVGVGCAIGAWIGAGLAVKKGNTHIKPLLLFIVLLTIAKLAFDYFDIEFLSIGH